MTDVNALLRSQPQRDRYGRYLIVPADGGTPKSYTRATTFAEAIDDRHNLERWMIRTTARGLVTRPDLYARLASLREEDKQGANRICDEAREAARASQGANLGTALHAFAERVDLGEDVNIPAPWDADIAAYSQTMVDARVELDMAHIEGTVVLDSVGVAGTFDRIVAFDGRLYIADLKTGADLTWSWNAISIQLALYAHGETIYDHETQTHRPMPAVDLERAIVIHLPAGKADCTLYWVDIAAGWEAVQHCKFVREWRRRRELAQVLVPVGDTDSAPGLTADTGQASTGTGQLVSAWDNDSVAKWTATGQAHAETDIKLVARVDAIKTAGHTRTLARYWPEGVPTFKQAQLGNRGHSADELELITRAVEQTEAEHLMTFSPEQVADPPTAEQLGELRARIECLPASERKAVDVISEEAATARCSLSLRQAPSVERYERARAALALAPFDRDVMAAVLSVVVINGESPPPRPPTSTRLIPTDRIGAVVGQLTVDQARRTQALCAALGTTGGIMLAFDEQQQPTFVGDLTPYKAA